MNGFESLFAAILSWSEEALGLAIDAGALAGLLAIVVLAVNICFRRWLSARQMSLLWGLVLLRLVLPVAPSSSLSLQNVLRFTETENSPPSQILDLPEAPYGGGYSQPLPALAANPYSSAPAALPAAAAASELSTIEDWISAILPLVWLIGALTTFLGAIIVHGAFYWRLKKNAACEDQRLLNLWETCRQKGGVRKNIAIVMTDLIEQPAILGLFRPKLLLPVDAAELDDRQLRMIMLHELAHVRRWHIAANWALLFIRAIHWWNPVYWLAAARFQNLREQSCDAFAIQRMEGESSREYGELLLTLIRRQHSRPAWRVVLPASILGFVSSFFRKRAVRNRIKALPAAGVTRSRWHAAAAAALVALAAACGLTDASTPEPAPERSFDRLPQASHDWSEGLAKPGPAPKMDFGPLVTRNYDIEKALKRIAEDARSEEKAREELKCHLTLWLGAIYGHGRFFASDAEHAKSGIADAFQVDQQWANECVSLDGTTLTVKASLNAHAELTRNLAAWEQSGLAQICVETRFISGPQDIASAMGISWRYLEAFADDDREELPSGISHDMPVVRAKAVVEDYLPIAVASLNEKQAKALLDRVTNLLQAPKVTLFNGQRAIVLDQTQTPFVVGIQERQSGAQDPKIAVIDEGIKLNLRTILSPDAARVQLEARIELSKIKRVGTVSTMLNGKPTKIQIPRVKRCRIDVSSEVDDGHSLLIGCIPAYEQKKFFYVLVTPRNLVLTADETD
ncbi:MAG TPA: M56 family metallopeptidase [Pirellulales bacterium]|nr:M56 family metallopeptidase [Pirellulales bacterium]